MTASNWTVPLPIFDKERPVLRKAPRHFGLFQDEMPMRDLISDI
jgi:hypothetical protein